jgi:hypothetical protein
MFLLKYRYKTPNNIPVLEVQGRIGRIKAGIVHKDLTNKMFKTDQQNINNNDNNNLSRLKCHNS